MLRPRRLEPGDAVGIVAPASPFDWHQFRKGLAVLEEMGLCPVVPESINIGDGYLAGSDAHRASMLSAMLKDPGIKGIVCARGGYGTLRLLPLLNFDAVAENPKVFLGSSDITILLNVFYTRTGLIGLHGPMVASLAAASELTLASLRDVLFANPMVSLVPENRRVICPGRAEGIVVGGNLTVLCHLLGTSFAPDFSGRILLLEDVGETPYRIDRMLTQMKLAGCFQDIAGIVLGSFKNCGNADQVQAVFADIFAESKVPVMAGFPIGHEDSNATVPIGLPAELDTAAGVLQYAERPFVD